MSQTPSAPRGTGRSPRRSVNIVAFIATGVVLGAIAGGVIDMFGPAAPTFNNSSSLAFLAAVGALIGGLLGGVVGSVLDVLAQRRH